MDATRAYDVIVVGSGSGASIVDAALAEGYTVGWVDKGPLGGTCMNVGCIPSKMVIAAADRVMEVRQAGRLGVRARVEGVDFGWIMERARRLREEDQGHIREGLDQSPDALGFYPVEGGFIDEHTLQVGDERIRGDRIFVVAGARPVVPAARGIEGVDALDNESVFELRERPRSLLIIGGGYVACEFAHFFEAMGAEVTVVQRNERLVPGEEPEISELLRRKLAGRMAVHTATEVVDVGRDGRDCYAIGRNTRTGETIRLGAERLMIAAGRRSNADLLRAEDAGIALDERGYIIVDEHLRTNVPHIWAAGDILGKRMFKHVANREALYAWHNAQGGHEPVAMDYRSAPHAIYTWPQIASVGMREEEAAREHDALVGFARYMDVARGIALAEADGFAKVIVDAQSEEILGFHIIGPHAPMLIQEAVNVMAMGATADALAAGMHIHPALSEVVLRALSNLHRHHH